MTRRLTFLLILGLVASPALAGLTTSQTWEFSPDSVVELPGLGFGALPTSVSNPNSLPPALLNPDGLPHMVFIDLEGGLSYDPSDTGSFSGVVSAQAVIPNYTNGNPLKYLDMRIVYGPDETSLTEDSVWIMANPIGDVVRTAFTTTDLLNGWWAADYSFELTPNPSSETVDINRITFAPFAVDSVTINTECVAGVTVIPAPGAALLVALGMSMAGWLKRRLA